MTKDKALNKVKDLICLGKNITDFDKVLLIDDVTNLVNEIYEDFDNRICKNCKWINNDMVCDNKESLLFDCRVKTTAGCNSFKRRTNEQ